MVLTFTFLYCAFAEKVSADRKFVKGERSVSAIEGNQLEIYCDIHGVDRKEFEAGDTKLEWLKGTLNKQRFYSEIRKYLKVHGPKNIFL